MLDKGFWAGKRVLLTGHTGFKGSWLTLWLSSLGARVTGYSLAPPTQPNLFDTLDLKEMVTHVVADIRDSEALSRTMASSQPEVILGSVEFQVGCGA